MKRLILPSLLAVAAIGLMLWPGAARATTTIVRDIPFETTIECGDTITLSGTVQGVFTEQQLDGGGFLMTYNFHPQGVTGTSASGIPYHATGLTRETTVVVPSGGLSDTFINRFHIVGTRGAPTYDDFITFHVTVTPSGDVTALIDHESVSCG
jgi:hypothetical protein